MVIYVYGKITHLITLNILQKTYVFTVSVNRGSILNRDHKILNSPN